MAEFKLIIFPVEERAFREGISHPLGAQELNRRNNMISLEEYLSERKKKRREALRNRNKHKFWPKMRTRIDFIKKRYGKHPLDIRFAFWTLRAEKLVNPDLGFFRIPGNIIDARLFFKGKGKDWNNNP